MAKTKTQSSLLLKTNFTIPLVGLGTWRLLNTKKDPLVFKALTAAKKYGYHHIDTAQVYNNEYEIGLWLRNNKNSDFFITSKVWVSNYKHYTYRSIRQSLRRLGVQRIDLMLLHWPYRKDFNVTIHAYKELVRSRQEGLVKIIGVSNFSITDLKKVFEATGEWPAVNQIIFGPTRQQKELRKFCAKHNIQVAGYSVLKSLFPVGLPPFTKKDIPPLSTKQRNYFAALGEKYRKSVQQIILRWCLEEKVVIFPKSASSDHIKENIDIFDFNLSTKEIKQIQKMDKPFTYDFVNAKKGNRDMQLERGLLFNKHFRRELP